ncbi:hypothetical protein QP162_12650 [Sphingomonas aurantiaca]
MTGLGKLVRCGRGDALEMAHHRIQDQLEALLLDVRKCRAAQLEHDMRGHAERARDLDNVEAADLDILALRIVMREELGVHLLIEHGDGAGVLRSGEATLPVGLELGLVRRLHLRLGGQDRRRLRVVLPEARGECRRRRGRLQRVLQQLQPIDADQAVARETRDEPHIVARQPLERAIGQVRIVEHLEPVGLVPARHRRNPVRIHARKLAGTVEAVAVNISGEFAGHDQIAEHQLLEQEGVLDVVRARPEHHCRRCVVDAHLAAVFLAVIDQRRHCEEPGQHLERAQHRGR